MTDSTSLRVRATLLVEAALAYGFRSRSEREGEILAELCGECGHHYGAHHGRLGEGACAETGCACPAWTPGPDGCPSCGRAWPLPALECEGCGTTLGQATAAISGTANEEEC